MRYFQLYRDRDISGVSGTGRVAEGVEFHDGQVCLSWYGKHHVIGVYPSIKDVAAIHGHEGATRIEWIQTRIDKDKQ